MGPSVLKSIRSCRGLATEIGVGEDIEPLMMPRIFARYSEFRVLEVSISPLVCATC